MGLFSVFKPRRVSEKGSPDVARIIEHDTPPKLIYAIGDIHGCCDKFVELESLIVSDASTRGGEATIVVLGDVVDRGPDSRGVIDRLLSPPPEGFTRITLSGNHESMMAAFLENPRADADWLGFGGVETFMSFGLDAGRWRIENLKPNMIRYHVDAHLSPEHARFIAERPYLVRFGNLVFVHAGVNRARPLKEQSPRDLMWQRPDPAEDEALASGGADAQDFCVIHGHTPVKQAYVSPFRINLDTGAYAGGPLSAARFVDGQFDGVLTSGQK